jgi:hypothetical protein
VCVRVGLEWALPSPAYIYDVEKLEPPPRRDGGARPRRREPRARPRAVMMPNRRASAVVVPPGSPGAQQARFPGGSRSTEVCRGADAPRQYVRVPPKCDTWSVHRHASRLKSKEEPGVVLKKRNAAPGVHVIVPTASEHQPTTYQPPEALRRAAESAAHSRQETSARGLPPTSPLTGASPGTSSGCGTQATETIRTHPHPSGSPAARGPLAPTRREALPGCVSHLSTT